MRKWLTKLAYVSKPEYVYFRDERECGIRAYPWELWKKSKEKRKYADDE